MIWHAALALHPPEPFLTASCRLHEDIASHPLALLPGTALSLERRLWEDNSPGLCILDSLSRALGAARPP